MPDQPKYRPCFRGPEGLSRRLDDRRVHFARRYSCGCWTCNVCRERNIFRWKRDLAGRLAAAAGQIHTWEGPAEEWRALKEHLRRRSPDLDYALVRRPGGQVLAVVRHATGSPRVSPTFARAAGERLFAALDEVGTGENGHPVRVSDGWRPKPEEKERVEEYLGPLTKGLTMQRRAEILRARWKTSSLVDASFLPPAGGRKEASLMFEADPRAADYRRMLRSIGVLLRSQDPPPPGGFTLADFDGWEDIQQVWEDLPPRPTDPDDADGTSRAA